MGARTSFKFIVRNVQNINENTRVARNSDCVFGRTIRILPDRAMSARTLRDIICPGPEARTGAGLIAIPRNDSGVGILSNLLLNTIDW